MTTKTYSFTFTDRETYIAWRSEWRGEYRLLSQDIRQTKLAIKNGMRQGIPVHREQWDLTAKQAHATSMLEERVASKLEAGRQYQAKETDDARAA